MGMFEQFIREMFSEWGSGVTAGISSPLFLWAIWVADPIPRTALAVLAIICVYIATYRVWKREHDRWEAECDARLRTAMRANLNALRTGRQS